MAAAIAPEKEKLISFRSLQRARTTVEDFVQSYFPLHGLRIPEDFWRHWDVLIFVEAAVYEMDEENEEHCQRGLPPEQAPALKGEQAIVRVLEGLGLLTGHIRLQLLQGKLYWQRERHICAQLAAAAADQQQQPRQQQQQPRLSLAEVHAASEAKSFDYRLLNHLLFSLRRQQPDTALLDFLFLDEHLVDIGDDLHDYEEDVQKNSFNIFRAYVHLFGPEAELKLIERISDFEARHAKALQQLPAWQQEAFHARRKQASAEPGSEKWVFPPPIRDEQTYRRQLAAG